ncbi:hypothetical protein RN001_014754 [Aquatica leii]|uniref:Peptidase M20 dimerisation domain-containing protein n=1 Tax=Aquatica leii TaxID=1421715 RepID=A0AAN7NUW0_9COLE|nr:hypothetical protein RN001_014754 [Aquatica leii]
MEDASKKLDNAAIENLRCYLRIPSVHPSIDYEPCLKFLKLQAEEIGLIFNVYIPVKNKPHAVLTWTGKQPELGTIILNSHMDVVPVFEDHWRHKPFDADVDENGDIYARGIQDTKTLGIQYLEAIRRLKQSGYQPKRTVHVTFVAEEETGGLEGMKLFVETPEFRKLNAAFALDEGMVSENNTAKAFYGEKRGWKFEVHCTGEMGHGSLLLDNTAGEKVEYLLNKFYKFRNAEKILLNEMQNWDNVTTVNLTMIKGGVQANVIPPEFTIVIDSRVPVEKFVAFESQVNQWCKEAGTAITIVSLVKDDEAPNTLMNETNIFWTAFKAAIDSLNIPLETHIHVGNTDGRYLRAVGVPTIGFSPIMNTKIRAHDNDEYVNENEFLNEHGIDLEILPSVCKRKDLLKELIPQIGKRHDFEKKVSEWMLDKEISEMTTVSNTNLSGITDITDEDINTTEDQLWLKHNVEPWDIVIQKWNTTFCARHSFFNKCTVDEFLKEWPILNDLRAEILINLDFEKLFPEAQLNFHLFWDTFFEIVHSRRGRDLKEPHVLDLMTGIREIEGDKVAAELVLLNYLVPPTGKVKAGNKLWKFSTLESIEGIIVHVKEPGSIHAAIKNKIDGAYEKGRTIQPYILVVGPSLTDIKTNYIIVDKVKYQFTSSGKAFDTLFKLFHVFNAEYPVQSLHIYTLIQKGVYKLNLKEDKIIPTIMDLLV